MKKEYKELLLKDLCVRLPYGIKVLYNEINCVIENIGRDGSISLISDDSTHKKAIYLTSIEYIKPYLRPMSSMTEDEKKEFSKLLVKRYCEEDWEGHISTSYCIEIDNVYTDDEDGIKYPSAFSMEAIDWLNANHFDYRDLIPKGLAIEAPDNMYKEEQQ